MKKEKEKRATFTPGPWHVRPGKNYYHVHCEDEVALVENFTVEDPTANARLIAAAPELHAQAKVLERLLVELAMQGETGTDEALDEVRAVLAKVDGGEG